MMKYFAWNLFYNVTGKCCPHASMLVEGEGFSCIILQQHLKAIAYPLVGVGREKESY